MPEGFIYLFLYFLKDSRHALCGHIRDLNVCQAWTGVTVEAGGTFHADCQLTGAEERSAGCGALPGGGVGIPHGKTVHVQVGRDSTGLDCNQVTANAWQGKKQSNPGLK